MPATSSGGTPCRAAEALIMLMNWVILGESCPEGSISSAAPLRTACWVAACLVWVLGWASGLAAAGAGVLVLGVLAFERVLSNSFVALTWLRYSEYLLLKKLPPPPSDTFLLSIPKS